MLESILGISTTSNLSVGNVMICILASIIFGLVIALVHMKTTKHSKNFIITLAILPT